MLRVTQLSGFGNRTGAAVSGNKILSGSAAAYGLTGTAAGVTKSGAGNKTLAAGAGSYSLAGTAANVTKAGTRTFSAATGSYSLTGTTAAVTKSGAEAAAFLARTSGLDTTHVNAYTALINGLVADGIWAKLDVLHIYATQDTATAQLNLVSSSFGATLHGAPAFTADRGYLGVSGSSTVYIDTGFNPSTASSPHYTRDDAHLSVWNLTNATTGSGVGPVGSVTTGTVIVSYPIPKFTDGNSYYRLNQTASAGNVTNADARGHYIVSRIANHEVSGYKNGSFVGAYNTLASSGLANLNIYSLGENNNGAALGVPYQLAAITIGASLGTSVSQTIPTALYNRLRTYMTAVGVP